LALRGGSETRVLSRNEKDFGQQVPKIQKSIAALDVQDTVIDGEIVALDEKGRSSFQLLQGFDMGLARPPIIFYAFDLLRLNGEDLQNLPIDERKAKLTVPEKSAAEIIRNLKDTPSYEFDKRANELYFGRWPQEPGWQATVHSLPRKLSGGLWHCSFREVGSGTLVMASTIQDISALRRGYTVTISGRISDVSPLDSVSLEEAIIRCDNLPS
jgi:ATP dependent DNA ligase domain